MHPSYHFIVSVLYLLREIAEIRCQEWSTGGDVDGHLQMARQLMSQGMYDDALSHFHAAIDADPLNYLTYYTRATVYLAIGRITSALKDLTKVIELKPDFTSARLQRGKVFLKQGRLDEAHIDYENVLRVDPMNHEAHAGYNMIEPVKRDIDLVYALVQDRNYQESLQLLDRLLQEVPWDVALRELRAECYESMGDLRSAISDLRSVLKSQSNPQLKYLKISRLHYEVGEPEESLNVIRECLRFDPDHKECFSHYKQVKRIANQVHAMDDAFKTKDYTECVDRADKALAIEKRVFPILLHIKSTRCKCYKLAGQYKKAIAACTEALDLVPGDSHLLCDRADAYLELSDFDNAVNDYQTAGQADNGNHRAKEGVKLAKKRQKQLKKRDYYSILGVTRSATKREILKAYRQLAQKWHPDNFPEAQKAEAEKKFIDIASAKEVLSDPEKRAKFDQGEDPLDPESQQQGFDPFQGFQFQSDGAEWFVWNPEDFESFVVFPPN